MYMGFVLCSGFFKLSMQSDTRTHVVLEPAIVPCSERVITLFQSEYLELS